MTVVSHIPHVIAVVLTLTGCQFPSHDFVSDDVFYASGGRTKATNTGGRDTSGLAGSLARPAGGTSWTAPGGASGDSGLVTGGVAAISSAGQTALDRGGAGPTTGGSAGTPNGGVAGRPVEDCLNSTDDDRDGLVDCEDPDCGDWTCRMPVPSGWFGPVAITSASSEAALSECTSTSGYSLEQLSGCLQLSQTPPSCPACPACAAVQNPTATATVDIVNQCSSRACATKLTADCSVRVLEGCNEIRLERTKLKDEYAGKSLGFVVRDPSFADGRCQPDSIPIEPTKALTPSCLEWARVCGGAAPAGSCASGQGVCVRRTAPPFGEGNCIYIDGAVTECPSGWGSHPQVMKLSLQDDRHCSPCTCSPPPTSYYRDAKPPISLTAVATDTSPDATCQTQPGGGSTGAPGCFLTFPGDFDSSGNLFVHFSMAISALPIPACLSAGGTPAGAVTSASSRTICCVGQ